MAFLCAQLEIEAGISCPDQAEFAQFDADKNGIVTLEEWETGHA